LDLLELGPWVAQIAQALAGARQGVVLVSSGLYSIAAGFEAPSWFFLFSPTQIK